MNTQVGVFPTVGFVYQFINDTENSATLFALSVNGGTEGVYECRGANEFASSSVIALINILR